MIILINQILFGNIFSSVLRFNYDSLNNNFLSTLIIYNNFNMKFILNKLVEYRFLLNY